MNAGERFERLLGAIGDGVPDAAQYREMADLTLDVPQARHLQRLDPFSVEYRQAAMQLYLSLRASTDGDYVAARDERPAEALPDDLWRGLVPWSFQDAAMASEHLLAWGHILRHLGLAPGASVLEYGPGSGQILLMLARLGYRACGVDIDATALAGIRAQAERLGLQIPTEQAEFGAGFGAERFDAILFYECFHHAFEFASLLRGLHRRLAPGGRIILCGEPVVSAPTPSLPYPWGPRLDALSIFCIRRFGWMELGFTHDFLVSGARQAGWHARLHRFPACSRALLYVLTRLPDWSLDQPGDGSAAWRRRAPLRTTKLALARAKRGLRKVRALP